jgi:hypothetical protein
MADNKRAIKLEKKDPSPEYSAIMAENNRTIKLEMEDSRTEYNAISSIEDTINKAVTEMVENNEQLLNTENSSEPEPEIYTVENVLRRKANGSNVSYLLKWKGYPSNQNTWEPSENVKHLDLIKLFEEDREQNLGNSNSKSKSFRKSYSDAIGKIWDVEEVVKKRVKKDEIEYFLKWKGLEDVYNTWEPRKSVKHDNVVKQFEAEERKSLKAKKRKQSVKLEKVDNENSEISPKKSRKKLKLIEDPDTRKYYDCVTFNLLSESAVNTEIDWQHEACKRKMDKDNELDENQKEWALMWNKFMSNNRNTFRGKCHMKPAFDRFIQENVDKIVTRKLRSEYITHVSIMKDLRILNTEEAMEYIMLLNEKL